MTDKKKKKTHEEPCEDKNLQQGQPLEQQEQKSELSEFERLQAERDDLLARLQRTAADYANYQKRMARQMSEAIEYANNDLIKSLLPILDDMERALDAAASDDPMRQGMQIVYDKALEILGRYGLASIEASGKEFNPELHSAILHQPTDEYPPHKVIQEVQKGYQLKGRTIRPSHVIVSKENTTEENQAAEGREQ